MINDTAARPAIVDGAPSLGPTDTFEAAIVGVANLTLTLTFAIAEHAYAEGVYLRSELEHALCRAQALAEHIRNGSEHAEALRQLGEMQAVAARMLIVAPAPSSAAIQAAEAGDPSVWNEEKQAWIAGRLASGSRPRLPRQRRERRETRPESPTALRDTPEDDASAATSDSAIVLSPTPDKAGPL